ncbi:MAG: VCBS repeat-containing protein, partial [Armatimonadota bacterium]|nr:VCBS repeat-containing protein [Armatimonadota bacterium]
MMCCHLLYLINSPRRLLLSAGLFLLLIFSITLTGCRKPSPGPRPPVVSLAAPDGIRFENVAAASGIHFAWPRQPRPLRNIDAFGNGCAFLDYDNDGWQDILLVGQPHVALYHNLHNGHFEDVTAQMGLDKISGQWTGVAVGDYDGDGYLDILLTGFHRLALLRNNAGKGFTDVTRQAGLDPTNSGHWGSSAGFMDLDGSGR